MRLDRVHAGGRLVEQEDARAASPSRGRSRACGDSRTRGCTRAGSSGSRRAAGRRTRASPRRARSISRSSRRARGSAEDRRGRAPACVCPYAAAMTFSLTVMLRNSRRVWNVRATPRCVILCGASPTMLSSVEAGCRPRRAGRSPVTRLKSVVFPAPFGPMTLTISPSPHLEVEVCRRTGGRRRALLTPSSSRAGARPSRDLHALVAEQALRPGGHERRRASHRTGGSASAPRPRGEHVFSQTKPAS